LAAKLRRLASQNIGALQGIARDHVWAEGCHRPSGVILRCLIQPHFLRRTSLFGSASICLRRYSANNM
jgi:hypothetical protein